ncbi:hypothetical protein H1P_2490011 [Hyella patelloides LEGE 07179]|uniref:Uncharacterized protein n=1 Tax=Hyella patelloides LEGE 07179 TaxID=945734 RepID=A0A563VS42_9CYAN|nr:hypothetical protein H1P_2490011 [Hyella patelloides LEGE 07179]
MVAEKITNQVNLVNLQKKSRDKIRTFFAYFEALHWHHYR